MIRPALAAPLLTDPIAILAVLAGLVALSEWLGLKPGFRAVGSALVVIALGAIAANVGLIPTYGNEAGLYDAIFGQVAPLSIFWLLLGVDLRSVLSAGRPMLFAFFAGALGTVTGVLVAMLVIDGQARFGEHYPALGGMFVGTYIGGSANFNAVALEYGVQSAAPQLYTGATLVDAAATTVWMLMTAFLPRVLGLARRRESTAEVLEVARAEQDAAARSQVDAQTTTPFELAMIVGLGLATLVSSRVISDVANERLGIALPSMLVLSAIALGLAQLPVVRRLRGARAVGMASVLLFLAVIGVLCDVQALIGLEELGPPLILFVTLTIGIHGLVTFGAARLLGIDMATAAVASQCNVGGGTTGLALARGLEREDLVLPAILVGSLGTALGTFLGFAVAGWLG